jgi:hypothetical protein
VPIVQLSPGEYLVLVEHEGDYWCEDSSGVHSNKYHLRKKRSLVSEPVTESITDLWISDGNKVPHSGALKLIGSTMFPTEYSSTCPAQTQKDEHGVEYYWPAIELGRYSSTQTYSHSCLFRSMVLRAMHDFGLPCGVSEI